MNGQTVVFEVCVQMGLGLGGFDDGIREPLEAKNDSRVSGIHAFVFLSSVSLLRSAKVECDVFQCIEFP